MLVEKGGSPLKDSESRRVVEDDEVFLPAQEGGAGLLIFKYSALAFDL